MKKLLILAFLAFAPHAFANVADVEPSADVIKPSLVEQVITVQGDSEKAPRITLTVVDNGGSSDVSAMVAPSRLYLSFHLDGESFDIDASYQVVYGLSNFKLVSVDKKRGSLVISFDTMDEHFKTHKNKYRVIYGQVLEEIGSATGGEDDGYTVKSTVGIQAIY